MHLNKPVLKTCVLELNIVAKSLNIIHKVYAPAQNGLLELMKHPVVPGTAQMVFVTVEFQINHHLHQAQFMDATHTVSAVFQVNADIIAMEINHLLFSAGA